MLPDDIADVVRRLRSMAGPNKPNACDDAADLIEQMAEQLEHKAIEHADA